MDVLVILRQIFLFLDRKIRTVVSIIAELLHHQRLKSPARRDHLADQRHDVLVRSPRIEVVKLDNQAAKQYLGNQQKRDRDIDRDNRTHRLRKDQPGQVRQERRSPQDAPPRAEHLAPHPDNGIPHPDEQKRLQPRHSQQIHHLGRQVTAPAQSEEMFALQDRPVLYNLLGTDAQPHKGNNDH